MAHQTLHYSDIIQVIDNFKNIVREYFPIKKNEVGSSGFYSFYDIESETQQTHILVTLDILLEIISQNFNQSFNSITIKTDSKPIKYHKKDKTQILVGFKTEILEENDYYSLEPEKFWFQTTFEELPNNVGFCEKSL